MTLNDLWGQTLCLLNVSIHRNVYKNWFVNKWRKEKKPWIHKSPNPFFVRYRRELIIL